MNEAGTLPAGAARLPGGLQPLLDLPPEFIELLPVAAYACDAAGRVLWFNKRAADLWGRAPRIGDDTELFCGSYRLYFGGRQISRAETPMAAALRTGEPVHGAEGIVERPDGSQSWATVHIEPVRDAAGTVVGAINCFSDTTELQRARGDLAEREARLSAELEATRELQAVSAELIHERGTQALYEKIMDAAVAIMRSDFASMQMFHPERGQTGELQLLAFRGFDAETARFWEWVRADSGCTCGEAMRTGQRAVAADVEACAYMAGTADREAYLRAGIQAVQSTPLISRSGRLLGMISTHWREPHQATESQFRRFDLLARQAADLIERAQAEETLRRNEERQAFLLDLNDALRPLDDPIEIQGAAAGILGERLGLSRAYYVEYDAEAGFATVARDYVAPGAPSLVGRYDRNAYRTVLERIGSGQTWIVTDVASAEELAPAERGILAAQGVVAWIDVPLLKEGKLVAIFCAVQAAPRRWTAVEVALIEATAERTWAAVERARAEAAFVDLTAAIEQERRIYNTILSNTPDLAYVFGLDHRFTYANSALLAMWGRSWDAAMHDREIEEVIATRQPIRGEVPFNGALGRRIYDYIFVPVIGPGGRVEAVAGTTRDITDLKQHEDRQKLLIDELNHRVKNTLATVQSLAAQSLRTAPTPAQARVGLEARLFALAGAHDVLTRERWEGADLRDLVLAAISAYAGEGGAGRFAVEGPVVRLQPQAALALSMALHELATNAIKYGALSTPAGNVRIRWSVGAGEQAGFHMGWTERGGPPVVRPSRRGFGSRLIERSLARTLGGSVMLTFAAEGVVCTIETPASEIRAGDVGDMPPAASGAGQS